MTPMSWRLTCLLFCDAQYQLTLTEEVEVRYRTETRTDSEGNSYTVEVPYNYYILNVTLISKPISSVASELLTPDQLEMYQVYRATLGNKPLIFGGGSPDMGNSEDLTGVEFVNVQNPALLPASPRASPGSNRTDNGVRGDMPTSPPVTPFSLIGTWMAAPTMWGL